MNQPTLVTSLSKTLAVAAAAAQFTGSLTSSVRYLYTCDIASWIAQGVNPTASAADGSTYVPAGVPVYLDGKNGAKVSALRAGGSNGIASLTPAVGDKLGA